MYVKDGELGLVADLDRDFQQAIAALDSDPTLKNTITAQPKLLLAVAESFGEHLPNPNGNINLHQYKKQFI